MARWAIEAVRHLNLTAEFEADDEAAATAAALSVPTDDPRWEPVLDDVLSCEPAP